MVSNLEYGGCKDWFLPSIGELKALFKALPNQFPEAKYWSSTVYWEPIYMWDAFHIKQTLVYYDLFLTVYNSKNKESEKLGDGKYSIIAVRRF